MFSSKNIATASFLFLTNFIFVSEIKAATPISALPQCQAATLTYSTPQDFSKIDPAVNAALVNAGLLASGEVLNAQNFSSVALKFVQQGYYLIPQFASYTWLVGLYNDFLCPINSQLINQMYNSNTVAIDSAHKASVVKLINRYSQDTKDLYNLFYEAMVFEQKGDSAGEKNLNVEFLKDISNVVDNTEVLLDFFKGTNGSGSLEKSLKDADFYSLSALDKSIVNEKNLYCTATQQLTFMNTKKAIASLVINPPKKTPWCKKHPHNIKCN